jgi:Serine dehydrogenase proteinase
VNDVRELEKALGMPVILFVQDGPHTDDTFSFDVVGPTVTKALYDSRGSDLNRGKKVALLVDSYGGLARSAFEIANLLRKYCGGFTAIIPRHAKSAATLLILGAERLIMSEFAELGPLDMQVEVPDREERMSVLDEAQALDRLNAFAMNAIDEVMFLLLKRTGMKVATLLPHVRELVTGMMRPLFESVDVVRLTQVSRILKVTEEYAIRLLMPRFPEDSAKEIASKLAENYPEHGFIIYREEAQEIGLTPEYPTEKQAGILSRIIPRLSGMTAIGRIQKV